MTHSKEHMYLWIPYQSFVNAVPLFFTSYPSATISYTVRLCHHTTKEIKWRERSTPGLARCLAW
jgi:hypothetical protein